MPDDEYDICPCFTRASATSSFKFFTGSDGCDTSIVGSAEISAIGAN